MAVTVILKFFRGRKGNIIAKLSSGKVAIVDKKAKNKPKPKEKWVCRVTVEKPNYVIVEPLEKVVTKEVRVIKKFCCGHTVEETVVKEVPESCKEIVDESIMPCEDCYKKATKVERKWEEEHLRVFFRQFEIPEVPYDKEKLKKLEKEMKHCEEELNRKIEDIKKNAKILKTWLEKRSICIEYSGYFHDDDKDVKATVVVAEVEYGEYREVVEAYKEEDIIEEFIEKIKEKLPEYKRFADAKARYIEEKFKTEAYVRRESVRKALLNPKWKKLYDWLINPATECDELFKETLEFARELKKEVPFADIPDTCEKVKSYIMESLYYEAMPPTDFRSFDELDEDDMRLVFSEIIRLAKSSQEPVQKTEVR